MSTMKKLMEEQPVVEDKDKDRKYRKPRYSHNSLLRQAKVTVNGKQVYNTMSKEMALRERVAGGSKVACSVIKHGKRK